MSAPVCVLGGRLGAQAQALRSPNGVDPGEGGRTTDTPGVGGKTVHLWVLGWGLLWSVGWWVGVGEGRVLFQDSGGRGAETKGWPLFLSTGPSFNSDVHSVRGCVSERWFLSCHVRLPDPHRL